MHFEWIRNVSDHFVNQKEIAMWSERVVIVHQIITHFCRRDNLLLHGESFYGYYQWISKYFRFHLYSKKIGGGTCIINFFKTLLIGIDFPKLIISALSLLRLNAVIGNYWRAVNKLHSRSTKLLIIRKMVSTIYGIKIDKGYM